jgi:serine O-acetyltransferase
MPEIFFISHGIGSVIGNAKFGNNFVFFQNITVGRVNDLSPQIGSEVIMYPGSVITGNSIIGNNVVVSANTVIHNYDIPNNSIVFPGNKIPVIKPLSKNYIELYLSN